jgi:hypothetical protein
MKRKTTILLPYLFFALITACSKDKVNNSPPSVPVAPTNLVGTALTDTSIQLTWTDNSSNEDGFTIFRCMTSEASYSQVETTTANATAYTDFGLREDTVYAYYVTATNTAGHSAHSDTVTIRTLTHGNHPPNLPSNPIPANGAINVPDTVVLTWGASDPDWYDDALISTVYFGTTNPPPYVASGIPQAYDPPGDLQGNTTYYWKICVRDSRDATTCGPVWSFTTSASGARIDLIGNHDTPDQAWTAYVNGNYAYVADRYTGLIIFDVSNPAAPESIGCFNTHYYTYSATVNGNYAYCDDGFSLRVLDISNRHNPVSMDSLLLADYLDCIAVSGNYAYVANAGRGLRIIDISNPNVIQEVGSFVTNHPARGVYVEGSYAYVAAREDGLVIFNISTPSSPYLVGSFDTGGSAEKIRVIGNYAYVADWDDGLVIIDISIRSSPALIGSIDTPGFARSIDVLGTYAYIADVDPGIEVFDISHPSSPTLAASHDTPGSAYGIFVANGYVYLADYSAGLRVFRFVP